MSGCPNVAVEAIGPPERPANGHVCVCVCARACTSALMCVRCLIRGSFTQKTPMYGQVAFCRSCRMRYQRQRLHVLELLADLPELRP